MKPSKYNGRSFSILIATVAVCGVRAADPPKQNSLRLVIKVESISHGTPQAFTFKIVNNTDHDIYLPKPTVECSDSFDGALLLNVKFTPLNPDDDTGGGSGCAADGWGDWPSIIVRLKSWLILRAGKSLTINANKSLFLYEDNRPGRYEFWATFKPAFVKKVDQELLLGMGIDFPSSEMNSNHLTFDKPR
jgi:hypothetical protein